MKKMNQLVLLLLLLGISGTNFAQITLTSEFLITSGSDDAEQGLISGGMDLSSSDVEMTQDGSSDQLIGLRFSQVDIPAGSTIESAYLQVIVDEVHTTGVVNVLIGVQDAASPATFSAIPFDIFNRPVFYGDTLVWNPGPFAAVNDQTADQRSIDIAQLVAHSVNNPDWESGNPIALIMIDPVNRNVPGYTGNAGIKRVFKTNNNGGSTSSARLIVTYTLPNIFFNGTFPIAAGSVWKYNDQGMDLGGEDWTAIDYAADSAWAFGNAKLGYGDGNEATVLSFGGDASNKYPTYYFRHIFDANDVAGIDSLLFNVRRDDGAVVYVNGVEAFRMNMPEGDISYSTFASSAVGGSAEISFFAKNTANLLQEGLNVIAVEVHQSDAGSSDMGFDMSVEFTAVPLANASFPLNQNSEWSYLDNGADLGVTDWTSVDFNDYTWKYGPAALGYGDPVNTTLSFGPDANNKYITTYFRRAIDIDLASLPEEVVFGLRRDDGAVVYLNGVEVIRSNMPEGNINYLTFSSTIISGGDETTFNPFVINKSAFVDGVNQIAVELHNRDGFSSDLIFDMSVKELPAVNPSASCDAPNIGCFTSISPTSETSNMILPVEHRFQMIFKQGEQYTDGSGAVPGNHDFTGYVANNGSSEMGVLSVNHENSPGAVSMLDIRYNNETRLWEVDNSQPVDFFDENLVTTTRNCSGGITPWGTVITSEESTNGGDANGDGYQDVGWNVEIDPVTKSVVDYDGDGKKDKLWAMGRMSHENVAVASDSITVYYGEDGGTQCVYKFVADSPANLSSGSVYVLSLDAPLAGNDPTGSTGQWILVPNETQADRNNLASLAGALGGTNFNGVEDCEIGPIDGKIYFTAKGRNRVYRFTDTGTGVDNFETFVGGTSYTVNTAGGPVTEPWADGNDNLTFDGQGNLWVLQDGGRNYIWVVRPDHSQVFPNVELFLSSPIGSEPTGLTFSPDFRFGFFSIQHPSGSSNAPQIDASGNEVIFNASATVVFSLVKDLGEPCEVVAPNVVLGDGTTEQDICLGQGVYTLVQLFKSGSEAAGRYAIVNADNGAVMDLNNNGNFNMSNFPAGDYFGVFVAVNQVSDLIGITNINDITGCFALSNFTLINTSVTVGGLLTTTDPTTNCGSSIQFSVSGAQGADTRFLLLNNNGTTIVRENTTGTFMLNELPLGTYRAAHVSFAQATDVSMLNPPTLPACDAVSNIIKVRIRNCQAPSIMSQPNPTSGASTVTFSVPEADRVSLEVYDMNGRMVSQLFTGDVQAASEYRFQFDGSDLPAGVYIYRLTTTYETVVDRFMLTR